MVNTTYSKQYAARIASRYIIYIDLKCSEIEYII